MTNDSSPTAASPAQVRSRLYVLIAFGLGSIVVFIANYGFFVRTTLGQELDNAALIGSEHESQGVITEAWDRLDIISVASLALACVAIGLVAVLRRRFALAFAALATIGAANVVTQLLKRAVLERPDLIGEGAINSLPSGHATVAATAAVGLVMVTAPRWRSTVALVSVLFPISIAVAVVTASWHRPSDSIAAFCVVLSVAMTSLAVVVRVVGFDAAERPPRWLRRSTLALVGAAIVVLGGLSLLGLWAVRDRLRDGPLDARWESAAYAASTAGITAGALAMMVCLVVAVRGVAVGHGGWNRDDDEAATDAARRASLTDVEAGST
jgi:membrane-associated phospholipid phosphatase